MSKDDKEGPECPTCKEQLLRVKVVVGVWCCFKCMKTFMATRSANGFETMAVLYTLKRLGPGDWKIGSNAQLQKNALWDEEIESLFSQWIAKKVLECTTTPTS